MYLDFFGLRELPFTLTPNTDFYIDLGGHHRAFEVIQQALDSGEGFIKITGEVGTGKTLLCRRLLNRLHARYVTAYIPNPFLSPDGLMLVLAEELNLPVADEKSRDTLLGQINCKLLSLKLQGKKIVFLLDEAQAMPEDSIEALRLLANLETESEQLLQIVLFGQPELNSLLNRSSLRQLKQRVTFTHELPVLTHEETANYINQRLAKAGFPGENLFSKKAMDKLFAASTGIPRLINILSHKAMLVAYGRGETRVSHLHVERAVEDTGDVKIARPHVQQQRARFPWLTVVFACVASSVVSFALAHWLL
jgi:MSHA biogenesis protein MshM